jgi:hypothetical protein
LRPQHLIVDIVVMAQVVEPPADTSGNRIEALAGAGKAAAVISAVDRIVSARLARITAADPLAIDVIENPLGF